MPEREKNQTEESLVPLAKLPVLPKRIELMAGKTVREEEFLQRCNRAVVPQLENIFSDRFDDKSKEWINKVAPGIYRAWAIVTLGDPQTSFLLDAALIHTASETMFAQRLGLDPDDLTLDHLPAFTQFLGNYEVRIDAIINSAGYKEYVEKHHLDLPYPLARVHSGQSFFWEKHPFQATFEMPRVDDVIPLAIGLITIGRAWASKRNLSETCTSNSSNLLHHQLQMLPNYYSDTEYPPKWKIASNRILNRRDDSIDSWGHWSRMTSLIREVSAGNIFPSST
ncbi:hypothetical protein HY310_02615, partial [Candidatus Microgenomates bacterium]|nr:hypothetical protein [Candidatus Microgenomates bacterium]